MSATDNRFYRERAHLGVTVQMDLKQADQLLAHLCEVEFLSDLEPQRAAELDVIRRLLAAAITLCDVGSRSEVQS